MSIASEKGSAAMKQESPIGARTGVLLGYLGLIPFFVSAALNFLPDAPFHYLAMKSLTTYGAIILSFLGGVRWGLVISGGRKSDTAKQLGYSVLPALAAWTSLLFSSWSCLTILSISFVALYYLDSKAYIMPPWYKKLRLPLSVGALLALFSGFLI